MTVRHFCTYFDHNYLPRGMVMLESLHEHCPQAHVHVLCLSEQCHTALTALAYPHVSLLRLADLEAADPELAATRSTRSLVEYYFTITPSLPWHLLTRGNGIEEVTYLDADMMFFSSPEPIFDEAKDASVIITPHRFSAHLVDLVKYGIFNVSWMTFRRTVEGEKCLAWYRAACLNWCKDELEETRFADQKYLDSFSKLFAYVHAVRHGGAGVAPWNLAGSRIEKHGTTVTVDNDRLIFYHAQGFKNIRGPFYASGLRIYDTPLTSPARAYILRPYAKAYRAAALLAKKIAGVDSFSTLRTKQKTAFRLFRDGKMVFLEWKRRSLLVCCP